MRPITGRYSADGTRNLEQNLTRPGNSDSSGLWAGQMRSGRQGERFVLGLGTSHV